LRPALSRQIGMAPRLCQEDCMSFKTSIDPITEADFGTIAGLAGTIWREHYPAIISMKQIDYMLAGRCTADNLRRYINATDRGLALLKVSGSPAGYCSYALAELPGEMKLEQLYLLAQLRGKGLGGIMLRFVETQARKAGCRVLWLTVNKQNATAIAVYRKSGFTVRESASFDIGGGYVMDDYVMEKLL
jgi:ribosomal protein S18 acetylase RimI-like enzyme